MAVARGDERLVQLEADGAAAAAAGQDSCHTSPRMIGTADPPAVIPSTSISGPPIMKSVWIVELLKPSSSQFGLTLAAAALIASRMPAP